ncbi:hypothetical protein OAM04_03340 [bacterium]|nr:hypothetical protein [Verrucomicrobiales bacterium]MDC0312234.1 hypothetical protein [bacterium]
MDSSSSNNSSQSGKVSLEIILVVSVLVGLGGTIFAAVSSYRSGTTRDKCVKNIASIQQAVRVYQTTNQLKPGAEVKKEDLIGGGKVFELEPCCPAGGESYTWQSRIPLPGVPLVKCRHVTDLGHAPTTTRRW